MQLYYSPTSPYARKVLVVARETGLDSTIELVAVNPWDPESAIVRENPLGKVPALRLSDGLVLYDSPVICEYLDNLHRGEKLLPTDGGERWRVLCLQALADGMMDAALLVFLEHNRRAATARSDWWLQLQAETLHRAVAELERQTDFLQIDPDIGRIATACALGYLDFRITDYDWRKQAPRLAEWYLEYSARPAMRATEPD